MHCTMPPRLYSSSSSEVAQRAGTAQYQQQQVSLCLYNRTAWDVKHVGLQQTAACSCIVTAVVRQQHSTWRVGGLAVSKQQISPGRCIFHAMQLLPLRLPSHASVQAAVDAAMNSWLLCCGQ
jgi:hypothetical protein